MRGSEAISSTQRRSCVGPGICPAGDGARSGRSMAGFVSRLHGEVWPAAGTADLRGTQREGHIRFPECGWPLRLVGKR